MGSRAGWNSLASGYGQVFTGHTMRKWMGDQLKGPEPPKPPELPAPVEEVDLAAQQEYSRKRLKGRKGRSSTILGSNNRGKTVLG